MGVVVQFGSGLLHVCVGRCLCHVLGSFWMPVGLGSCSCFVPRWQTSGRVSLQFPLVHWDSCLLGSAFPARIVAELLPRCEASGLWYSWGLWTPGSQAIVGGLLYLPTRIINYILWQRHRYSRPLTQTHNEKIVDLCICALSYFSVPGAACLFPFSFFPYFLTVGETLCFFICALNFIYIFSHFFLTCQLTLWFYYTYIVKTEIRVMGINKYTDKQNIWTRDVSRKFIELKAKYVWHYITFRA